MSQSISGMPIAMLSGLGMPMSDQAELLSIANGSDFAGLEGLGAISDEEVINEFESGFYNVLIKTRNQVINHPEIFSKIQNPIQLKEMLDQAIKYYYTDKRDQVFDKLAEIEEKLEKEGLINLQGIYYEDGFDPYEEDINDWMPVHGVPIGAVENDNHYFDGENIYIERNGRVYMAGLGDVYGFFKKAKKALKKTGKKVKKATKTAVKKTVHAIMHVHPATIAIRMAFRAGIKMNVAHLANKLAYGYLTWEEAEKEGFSKSEWRRVVRVREKTYDAYKRLGGKLSAFRKAIIKGNRKNGRIERVKPTQLYPEVARANLKLERMKLQMMERMQKNGSLKSTKSKASARALRGIGNSDLEVEPIATEATENANPETMAETKAAGGLFKKIGEWFKGLFDPEARAARKAEREKRRAERGLEPELDAEGNPVLDENGQPKMKEKQGLFDRMNNKKDTRGAKLFDKAFDAGSDVLVHKIKEKGGVPSNQPALVYNSQPDATPVNNSGGGISNWIKNNKMMAAGIGIVTIGLVGYGIFKVSGKRTPKTRKQTEKKPLSGVKLK
jgi:hypothetical protein